MFCSTTNMIKKHLFHATLTGNKRKGDVLMHILLHDVIFEIAHFFEASFEHFDKVGRLDDHGDFPPHRVESIPDLVVFEEEIQMSCVDLRDRPRGKRGRSRGRGASSVTTIRPHHG